MSEHQKPKAYLRLAMAWNCDHCGRDILLETPCREEDGAFAIEEEVDCPHCGEEHETEVPLDVVEECGGDVSQIEEADLDVGITGEWCLRNGAKRLAPDFYCWRLGSGNGNLNVSFTSDRIYVDWCGRVIEGVDRGGQLMALLIGLGGSAS